MNKHYHFLKQMKRAVLLLAAVIWVAPMVANAQVESGYLFQQQFQKYQPQVLQEKLFVHTDKEFYLAGETIWFKIYALEGSTHKPLDVSKVVYLELISGEKVPVLQAKVQMENGTGSGSLQLPVTLSTENFTLRAYTNWMKNFSPEFFFGKNIAVVNTLAENSSALVNAHETKTLDVQFFPEGGRLVQGLESKLAFKAVDAQGKGVDFKGAIINQQNDTVARFQPLKFGMGSFLFTPQPNTRYRAVIKVPKRKPAVYELPAISEKGYTMQLQKIAPGVLTVKVLTNVPAVSHPQTVYLFVHTRQQAKVAIRGDLQNGLVMFTMKEDLLGEGISHFTLFNEEMRPVCERLYFKRPVKGQLHLQHTLPSQQVATREKVTVDFLASNYQEKPQAANLSFSVFLADSMQQQGLNKVDMPSYVWLASDLRGYIESAAYYLKNNGEEVDAALDNLLLTQGWRRFTWEDVLQEKVPVVTFLPESEGPSVTVQLTHKQTNQPARNIVTFFTLPDTAFQFAGGVSGKDGKVRFIMSPFYGPVEAVVRSVAKGDTVYNALIQNPFSEQYASTAKPGLHLARDWQKALQQQSLYLQVQKHFSPRRASNQLPLVNTGQVFFGVPDKQYILADYTKFPTLEDVFREYVPEVLVRRRDKNAHLYVMDHRRQTYFQNEPLVLLDGVPLFENNKLVSYNPKEVKKLELITKRYYLGPFAFDGIMNLTTHTGDLSEYKLDPTVFIFDYQGLERQKEFYAPVYTSPEQKRSSQPDFRNVLHWAPNIKTDAQGKTQVSFFTSDMQGRYIGVLQGLTTDGAVGSHTFTFQVTTPLP